MRMKKKAVSHKKLCSKILFDKQVSYKLHSLMCFSKKLSRIQKEKKPSPVAKWDNLSEIQHDLKSLSVTFLIEHGQVCLELRNDHKRSYYAEYFHKSCVSKIAN